MQKLCAAVIVLAMVLLCGTGICESEKGFQMINAVQAREIMDNEEGYVILDVRTDAEFGMGHNPGALLIPHNQIEEMAEEMLPDKDQMILVYCRSGNRSKTAAKVLVEMGYTNVVEFGGIIDWPYEIEK